MGTEVVKNAGRRRIDGERMSSTPAQALRSGSAGASPARGTQGLWHSRGYLPHFDKPGLLQMIAFRLADSLPATVISRLGPLAGRGDAAERGKRLEHLLGKGYGACHLRDARIASLVEAALLHFDGVQYRLLAWVVMPNHVHALIETFSGYRLSEVAYGWKSVTAKSANVILGRTGRFWQPEYFDRAIRDERHLASAVDYIHGNPCRAGLVRQPGDWLFSSAARSVGTGVGEAPALPGGVSRGFVDW